jgi:hypothetical protein
MAHDVLLGLLVLKFVVCLSDCERGGSLFWGGETAKLGQTSRYRGDGERN